MTTTATATARWTPPWGSALPPPVNSTTTTSETCPICLEDSVEDLLTMCACRQGACFSCHTTWFRHRQRNGRATCPVCAEPVGNVEEWRNVLGLEAGEKGNDATNNGNQHSPIEEDELLEAWLTAINAKKCPECDAWIEKNGGCEHMTCICGYEFCWFCLRDYEECSEAPCEEVQEEEED